ncbi:acyl-coenzyme A diphosphatase FITM2 [Denticeps clupeoides]|uniref:Fat storage-inducing transmembrane protein 2 n=1 Tax=Denticeps clupeoides TaxID=299321 RepID=A0AAY4DCT0_9TELE|nr:fat storage-inducing transmembrane protein 2 [Denticeps clupeoides]
MAAADAVVGVLGAFWRRPDARRLFPLLFPAICVVGSLLKELDLVPQSYFSSSGNVLNVFFVKVSWGWTIFLLAPFVALSNSISRPWAFVLRRLSSLLVATGIWYVCTETFFFIEDLTGCCYETGNVQVVLGEFQTKAACKKAGFYWEGFDISGHSFILSYSALVIVEEMAGMVDPRSGQPKGLRKDVLSVLYVSLNCIVALWVLMFASTSVYFHTPVHKILGTGTGLFTWLVTYHYWYLMEMSPGLPPKPKVYKQRA